MSSKKCIKSETKSWDRVQTSIIISISCVHGYSLFPPNFFKAKLLRKCITQRLDQPKLPLAQIIMAPTLVHLKTHFQRGAYNVARAFQRRGGSRLGHLSALPPNVIMMDASQRAICLSKPRRTSM